MSSIKLSESLLNGYNAGDAKSLYDVYMVLIELDKFGDSTYLNANRHRFLVDSADAGYAPACLELVKVREATRGWNTTKYPQPEVGKVIKALRKGASTEGELGEKCKVKIHALLCEISGYTSHELKLLATLHSD